LLPALKRIVGGDDPVPRLVADPMMTLDNVRTLAKKE
jgi:hypothetical protein